MTPVQVGQQVPGELAECELTSSSGASVRFGDLWSERPVLALFIRHFGCIGCSENVGSLAPRLAELADMGTRTVLIGCGASTFIEGFVERHHLLYQPVEVLTDPTLTTHQAAGLTRSLWGNVAPLALARAFAAGHTQSSVEGDAGQQGGTLLIGTDGKLHFLHRNQTLGDHAAPELIVNAAMTLWARRHPEVV